VAPVTPVDRQTEADETHELGPVPLPPEVEERLDLGHLVGADPLVIVAGGESVLEAAAEQQVLVLEREVRVLQPDLHRVEAVGSRFVVRLQNRVREIDLEADPTSEGVLALPTKRVLLALIAREIPG
jgi:hypothetical protein